MRILVLGSGLVGHAMAADLAAEKSFDVTVADINTNNLGKIPSSLPIRKVQADLSDATRLKPLLAGCDIVVNAVPGFMGYAVMKEIIEAGKNVVDIAFYPEDPFGLDALAREKNVTAIVDCGVAPGMSNLLTGYVSTLLDTTETALIYVGGLPVVREWPYEYKAGFSPIDVIEEYTRPARYIENGSLVVRTALSDPELITFPGIGTLEAFNSDGLRTLATTMHIPNMKEKTLRYPGHIDKIRVLRESGFFGQAEIDVKGVKMRPIDLTTRLLFPLWELKAGERDFTVMRVIVEGMKNGKKLTYTYDLLDYHDEHSGVHSMARVTGYTATAVVRLLSKGLFTTKGICPPEYIGRNPECVRFILDELEHKGISYRKTVNKA
jgi:lysine 6-dehydrogenase